MTPPDCAITTPRSGARTSASKGTAHGEQSMGRTINVQVFKYSELSATAKDKARSDHAATCGYSWHSEALASITGLAEHFGGKLTRYEVDWGDSVPCSPPTFDMPEMEPDEIAAKLATLGTYDAETLKGHGDCVLTGFCMDENAIDGFRAAHAQGERDLTKLMQAAFTSWLKAAQADYADQYSDEQFSENSDANEYEYYEDGELL